MIGNIEAPTRIEPVFIDGDPPLALTDLALEIMQESTKLPGRLPPAAAAELADLVRIMNCYYSNLIEGHNTRPVDIEKALASRRPEQGRPLLQEARAHVTVQRHLDRAHADGSLGVPTDVSVIRDIHLRFYDAMPEEFRMTTQDGRTVPIVPGAFRSKPEEDVAVGRHIPPSSSVVADFMDAFAGKMRRARTPTQLIIAIPAAHHRFNYVHPFVDGNGRVSRLMSHAMALRAGIGAQGLWSISRGLARGLESSGEYKAMMAHADSPRQGSRDGRGNLSEAALVAFSEWFLKVARDQIRFCSRAFDLASLSDRYRHHLEARYRDPRPGRLVSAVLEMGEVDRGRASAILGISERTARTILTSCVKEGFLKSDSPKGQVRVGFPVTERTWLFPGLFADETESRPRRTIEIGGKT